MSEARYQTVDYIDNNRQISGGFVFDGELWGYNDDEIGVATAAGGLHSDHIRYCVFGGRGTYIRDRGMTYGAEKDIDTY